MIPQGFAGWDLDSNSDEATNPAFGLEFPGKKGTYTRVQVAESVNLTVHRVPGEEAKSAMAGVRERIGDEDRFGPVEFEETPLAPGVDTLGFHIRKTEKAPAMHGLLAAAGGWLLFASSETEPDLAPFLAKYMKAVEADGEAEPPTPVPGERDMPDSAQYEPQ